MDVEWRWGTAADTDGHRSPGSTGLYVLICERTVMGYFPTEAAAEFARAALCGDRPAVVRPVDAIPDEELRRLDGGSVRSFGPPLDGPALFA